MPSTFNNLIIATGSHPIEIPNFKFEGRVIDSTGALSLTEVPKELVVVGGYTAAAFVLALTIFNYWASYRLFRHTNVINNKWINI